MGVEIDTLVIGDRPRRKQDQDPALKRDYKDSCELD
jgi:carbamoyltransferase